MNLEELEHGLDRWGSDLDSWPDAERKAALVLLESSEQARALLVQGQALDVWLDEGRTHRAPAQLKQKILAQLPRVDIWQRTADWFASALWRPALAGACALALGFATGTLLPTESEDTLIDDVAGLAFSETYLEFEDAP